MPTLQTLLAVLLVGTPLPADVEFFQTVDREKIGIEDTFRLTIQAVNSPDSATVQFPSGNDFEVLYRSMSSQLTYTIGTSGTAIVKRIQKHTLVLRATRLGKITIPPAVLAIGFESYQSGPLTLEVFKGKIPAPAAQPAGPAYSPPGAIPAKEWIMPGRPPERDGGIR